MATQILTLTVLRKRAGLSQEELALAIGKTQPDVSTWENGVSIPKSRIDDVFVTIWDRLDPDDQKTGLEPGDLEKPWDEVLLRLSANRV